MVKIQTITHQSQPKKIIRTPLAQHPFSRARQFQRAYNGVKLQKIFGKPFVSSFKGHSDGISCLCRCKSWVNKFISGGHDGEIRIWDMSERRCIVQVYEHTQSIKGVCFNNEGDKFISSSSDKTINLYDIKGAIESKNNVEQRKEKQNLEPVTKYMSNLVLGNVDHSPTKNEFITSGQVVQVWSYERTKPIYKLEWNVDTIFSAKYNPSQQHIICGSGIDRSIILYDLRAESPIQKIYLNNKCPCLSFNPIEPINITVGSEDSNLYTFDIRKMNAAKYIHKDHIGAITDIEYSPTGRQFVSASFDKTIRIFGYDEGRSRDVYHSKRMQIVNAVTYTMDGHYILSGSEDMNIRLWKSEASKPSGVINERERRAINYRNKLKQKFGQNRKIKRILLHRHLPKYILNAKKRRQDKIISRHNKRQNKEANTGIKEQMSSDKKLAVDEIQIEQKKERRRRKVGKYEQDVNHEQY